MSTFGGFQGEEDEEENLGHLKTQVEQIEDHYNAVKEKELTAQ